MNKSGSASKTTKKGGIPQAGLICMRVSMANNIQKPRSRERSSLTAGLVALTVALALVASLLYDHASSAREMVCLANSNDGPCHLLGPLVGDTRFHFIYRT